MTELLSTNKDDFESMEALGLPESFMSTNKRRRLNPNASGDRYETKRELKSTLVLPPPTKECLSLPFACRTVVAPMVGASDLAFRLLCRKYGADLVYTEMLDSQLFVNDEDYRHVKLLSQIHEQDRPLVVQFNGNDPSTMAEAAKLVAPYCDAIDINLGCPQSAAREGLFGAYLLEREHWNTVRDMVQSMRAAVDATKIISCKIRILPELKDTLELVKMLEEAGCGMLAVHGRTLGTVKKRRHGAADLDAIAAITKHVGIPVFTNGNVRRPGDIAHNLEHTGAAGIMVAEAILADPAIFGRVWRNDVPRQTEESKTPLPRVGDVALEYLRMAETHPPPGQKSFDCIRRHITYMLRRTGKGHRTDYKLKGPLTQDVLRHRLEIAQTTMDLEAIVHDTLLFHTAYFG